MMRGLLLSVALLAVAQAAPLQPVRSFFRDMLQGASPPPVGSHPPSRSVGHHQAAAAPPGKTGLPDSYVRVQDGRFVVGPECKEFIFAGWNMWEVVELGSNAPSPPFRSTPKKGQEHIVNVMNQGVAAGMKVIRVWAHSITEGWEMQTAPGKYNEKILHGMDFVMDEAHKRGLKLIWVIADNWYKVGGIDSYVNWGGSSNHADFFSSPAIKQIYKNHITFLANRVNSINGRKYSADPTIFAWDLANEARCQGCGNAPMQSWISEMCGHVKSVAPNALVGIGYEGFYGPGSGRLLQNPGVGSDWASKEGQNFVENSKVACIDYVGIHVWPDNWQPKTTDAQRAYIKAHLEDVAKSIEGKPFVLEEFGKITEDSAQKVRNEYFRSAYAVAEENVKAEGPLMGTLFWHWYDEGVGPGKYGVHISDTTWPIITAHVNFMNAVYRDSPDLCPA